MDLSTWLSQVWIPMFVFEYDAPGGSGETIAVSGPTSLEAVECRRFEAAGATSVGGDVRADSVRVDGSTSVGGDLVADDLAAAGSLGVAGDLAADVATLDGSTRVDGTARIDALDAEGSAKFAALRGDSATVTGALEATEVAADDLSVRGALAVESVSADAVDLAVTDDSTVGRLTADRVHVERVEEGGWGGDDGPVLIADAVTGESVTLAHTRAGTVAGGNVTIGPGCEVGTVRAADPEIHPDASVETVEEAVEP